MKETKRITNLKNARWAECMRECIPTETLTDAACLMKILIWAICLINPSSFWKNLKNVTILTAAGAGDVWCAVRKADGSIHG